jgi:Polyketide cyclase / dehydrase and lipid transport
VISFQASVRIERPIEEVFAFVADPLLFPRWNSAVQAVHGTPGARGDAGATYSMQRVLATGRVENKLEVFNHAQPAEFGIRTTSGPTPFVYGYRFASDGVDTVVHLDASVALPGVPAVLGPLAARGVRRGVDTNFAALKRTLEAPARDAHSPAGRARSQS